MTATVLGDLLARDRRTDAPALRAAAIGRQYDYRRLCTTAWKVGNLLRHFGVRAGSPVAVAGDERPEPILALLGAALLGGTVCVGSATPDARVLVAPTADLDRYTLSPGSQRIGYGDRPDDPSVAFFERDVWSENPTEPPGDVGSETPAIRADETTYTHGELLRSARSVVDRWELTTESVVAVRAPLERPETIVAGVVAPLVARATVLLPDGERAGEYAVVTETGTESRQRSIDAIEL